MTTKTLIEKVNIRIVDLAPMRVAALVGTGKEPEMDGWKRLLDWAASHHYLDKATAPRFFGFNIFFNPDESMEHDYEVWMTVGPEVKPDKIVTVKDFPGGHYAVTRVTGIDNIYDAWMKLEGWAKANQYDMGLHQCLEEHIRFVDVPLEQCVLDLYYPIKT